jgi:hypothetical protein
MTMGLSTTEPFVQQPAMAVDSRGEGSIGWFALVGIFLCAVGASLWQELSGQHACITFLGDSRHYLETCRQLTSAMLSCMHGSHVAGGSAAASSLLLDGPILPLVPAVMFAILNRLPATTDWQYFVAVGAVWHGASALLVTLLSARLLSRKWACAAGLCWAFYPAALSASGRFLTEGLTSLILLMLLWCATRTAVTCSQLWRAAKWSFAAGICCGVLLLLKPVLVGASALLTLVLCANLRGWKARIITLSMLAVGAAVVAAPWALFTYQVTGQPHLTPERCPQYNMAMGCDVDSDGWGALPASPLTELMTGCPDAGSILSAAWHTWPGQMLGLTLRKVTRLWSIEWNDFRFGIGLLSFSLQQWWHRALICLGIVGALAFLGRRSTSLSDEKETAAGNVVACGSVMIIAGHLMYAPFEAIARYGFSSMPFVVILAVYALSRIKRHPFVLAAVVLCGLAISQCCTSDFFGLCVSLTHEFRTAALLVFVVQSFLLVSSICLVCCYVNSFAAEKKLSTATKLAAAAVAVGCLAILGAFTLDGRQLRGWTATIKEGQTACRQIKLSLPRTPATAWVVIDGDSSLSDAVILVNGHVADDSVRSLFRLRPSSYFSCNLMRSFAAKQGKTIDEVRQWRAVAIPVAWLDTAGQNVIGVRARGNQAVTLYGDYDDLWSSRHHWPQLSSFSAGKLCNSTDEMEARLSDPVGSRAESFCWKELAIGRRQNDLSEHVGLQTGQYRICLLLGFGNSAAKAGDRETANAAPIVQHLTPLRFDPIFRNLHASDCRLCVNRTALKAAASIGCNFSLPRQLRSAKLLRIKLAGDARALHGTATVSVVPILSSPEAQHFDAALSSTPASLPVRESWQHFEICDEVPPNAVPGGLAAISVALYPGAWEETSEYGCIKRSGDACLKNLTLSIQPIDRPLIGDEFLAIY